MSAPQAVAGVGLSESQALGDPGWMERFQTARASAEVGRARADAAQADAASAADGGVDPKQMAQLRKVSQDFESLFLSYMLKVGRQATMKGGFMGQTEGEKIFTEMRDDELAKRMAHAGGIGLANLLVEQLSRTLKAQAKAHEAAAAQAGVAG